MKERLFFALLPDANAITQIGQVRQDLRASYPLATPGIPAQRLHVTLYFVGDFADGVSQEVLDSAHAAAKGITAKEFDLDFDTALSFRSKAAERPLVLCSSSPLNKLQLFRQELAERLRRNGLIGDKAAFTPHITLAYEQCNIPEQVVASRVEWTAREFVLIKSLVGKGHYEVLERWSLHAQS